MEVLKVNKQTNKNNNYLLTVCALAESLWLEVFTLISWLIFLHSCMWMSLYILFKLFRGEKAAGVNRRHRLCFASWRSVNYGLLATIRSGCSSVTAVEGTSGLIRLNCPLADAQVSQEQQK